MLDSQLLLDYSKNFFGYGNLNASIWFVGIEEAGGLCERVVADRLKLWRQKFKRSPIMDGYEFHRQLTDCHGNCLESLFSDPPQAQPTWDRLVRLQLAAQGCSPISNGDIAKFRMSKWARTRSDNCLIELLPLPSPSIKKWLYAPWTDHEFFQTRAAYQRHFAKTRAAAIKQLIADHQPEVVIFYGRRHMRRWGEIADVNWASIPRKPLPHTQFHRNNGTLYVVTHHPTAPGVSHDRLERIGKHIRKLNKSRRC